MPTTTVKPAGQKLYRQLFRKLVSGAELTTDEVDAFRREIDALRGISPESTGLLVTEAQAVLAIEAEIGSCADCDSRLAQIDAQIAAARSDKVAAEALVVKLTHDIPSLQQASTTLREKLAKVAAFKDANPWILCDE